MNLYSMVIQWSSDDRLFLVTIPEFADRVMRPYTHGNTTAISFHGIPVVSFDPKRFAVVVSVRSRSVFIMTSGFINLAIPGVISLVESHLHCLIFLTVSKLNVHALCNL